MKYTWPSNFLPNHMLFSKYAFSLSWATDPRSLEGYKDNDVETMIEFVQRHNLIDKSEGIVLAVNARVLAKDCKPIDRFLVEIPSSQLLVWTATGEPPISKRKISNIDSHFRCKNIHNKVGYDCKVR